MCEASATKTNNYVIPQAPPPPDLNIATSRFHTYGILYVGAPRWCKNCSHAPGPSIVHVEAMLKSGERGGGCMT